MKLYRTQTASMVALFCLSGMFLPGILKRAWGTAAYPALLLAPVIGILLLLLLTAAFRAEGGIAAIAQRRLGRICGGCVAVVYILYFLWIAGELLCFYGLYISAGNAPLFYAIPIAAAVLLAAGRGTTALGRTALLCVLPLLLFAFCLGGSGFVKGNFEHFEAFAVLSWEELLRLSVTVAVLGYAQAFAVTVLAEHRRANLLAVLLPNLAVILIAVTAVLLDGQTPLLNCVRRFSSDATGDFPELKVLAAFVLFFCAAFRMSVCLRAAADTTAELLHQKSAGRFLLPYAAVMLIISALLPQNIGAFAAYLFRFTPLIGVLPLCIFPIVLLARGRLQRERLWRGSPRA